MRAAAALKSRSRAAGALMVLLALLLRFAVPAGYMLAGDGALAIVPCPSVGLLPGMENAPPTAEHEMAMPMGTAMAHPDHHPASQASQDCPYAALAAPALPAAPPALPLPRPLAFAAPLLLPRAQPADIPALAAPPPPSRGPPHLS